MDPFQSYMDHLHEQNERELISEARSQFQGSESEFTRLLMEYRNSDPEGRGELLQKNNIRIQDESLSLAISKEMGQFLQSLVLTKRPRLVLELGSSNGVSTLYFARAISRYDSQARVIATELNPQKCQKIKEHALALHLEPYIDIHCGDVFETVASLQAGFDFVFLDIWSSGYLDLFKKIENRLNDHAIVIADNMLSAKDETADFKTYLDGNDSYINFTLNLESGIEYITKSRIQ